MFHIRMPAISESALLCSCSNRQVRVNIAKTRHVVAILKETVSRKNIFVLLLADRLSL